MSINSKLKAAMVESMPKLNKTLAEGIAYHHAKDMMRYCKEAAESLFLSLGPDFTLVNVKRCTPKEAYVARTQKQGSGGTMVLIDVSNTTQYTLKIESRFKDGPLTNIFINLPIISRFGRFWNGDTVYYVVPVLAGVPFSVERNRAYIALQRHRMNMSVGSEDYLRNGKRASSEVVYTLLHNGAKDKKVLDPDFSGRMRTSLQLVLFGKYGLAGAFKLFHNVDVRVIDTGGVHPTQLTRPEGMNIYTSVHRRASYKTASRLKAALPTRLGILISEEEATPAVESMVAAFFHVIDMFPDMFPGEEHCNGVEQWRVAMYYILFQVEQSEGYAISKIDDHYGSLDHYLDITKAKELARKGIVVNDFYEFCNEMCTYVPHLIENTSKTSMYDKRLITIPYLLKDVVFKLNQAGYEITKIRNKKISKGNTLQPQDINKVFGSLKPNLVMAELSKTTHPEVITTMIPNDLPPVKITNQVVPQAKAKGGGDANEDMTKDASLKFDASIAEVGSIMAITKGEGTGRNKLNLMVQCSREGDIIPRDKFKFLINGTNFVIGRHVPKSFIAEMELKYGKKATDTATDTEGAK